MKTKRSDFVVTEESHVFYSGAAGLVKVILEHTEDNTLSSVTLVTEDFYIWTFQPDEEGVTLAIKAAELLGEFLSTIEGKTVRHLIP